MLTTIAANSEDEANAVAIQPDGRIVVAGSHQHGNRFAFALARYTPNGRLTLVVFLSRVERNPRGSPGFDFAAAGWRLALVADASASPARLRVEVVRPPDALESRCVDRCTACLCSGPVSAFEFPDW